MSGNLCEFFTLYSETIIPYVSINFYLVFKILTLDASDIRMILGILNSDIQYSLYL